MNVMRIDHFRAIRSAEYREVIADQLAAPPPSGLSRLTVVHEDDDSCCRRQPWPVTLDHLLAVLAERRSVSSVTVTLDLRP